jgi:co-chaperonin GroES (HSP10)
MLAQKRNTEELDDMLKSLPSDKLTFTPLADKVLCQAQKVKLVSGGGLIMPDGTSNASKVGMDLFTYGCSLVIAVGPLCREIKAGDVVVHMFGVPCGMLVWQGETYMLTREYSIVGVVGNHQELKAKGFHFQSVPDVVHWLGKLVGAPPDVEVYMTDAQIQEDLGGHS